MKIIFFEGFSASSKDETETISYVYQKYINENLTAEVSYMTVGGKDDKIKLRTNEIKKILLILFKNSDEKRYLLIGKSLGAVKLHTALNDLILEVPHIIIPNRINVILIDPHAVGFSFDSNSPYYLSQKWKMIVFQTANFFQHNRYPTGAKCYNANYQVDYTGKNVDHFNIIRQREIFDTISDYIQ